MLAQKPGGNFSPLSFSAHEAASDRAAAGASCADAGEPMAQQVPNRAIMDHRLPYRRRRNMINLRSLRMHGRRAPMKMSARAKLARSSGKSMSLPLPLKFART